MEEAILLVVMVLLLLLLPRIVLHTSRLLLTHLSINQHHKENEAAYKHGRTCCDSVPCLSMPLLNSLLQEHTTMGTHL